MSQLLDAALRVSTLSADTSSDPLVEFLSTVLCNSILVLKQHAFVLGEIQNITVHKNYTSYVHPFFCVIYRFLKSTSFLHSQYPYLLSLSYSIVSVWIVMQSEIQKLVTRYIQPSASAREALHFLSSSSSNSSKVHMYANVCNCLF